MNLKDYARLQRVSERTRKRAGQRPRRCYAESREQQAFVERLRLHRDSGADWRLWLACAYPGGAWYGEHAERRAAIMRAEGLEPGVPDYELKCPNFNIREQQVLIGERLYVGLALEFKKPGSTASALSEAQERWRDYMRRAGWCWEMPTTADEAWRMLCLYLRREDLL